jgi:hypothetical protein
MKFLPSPIIQPIPGTDNWVLHEKYEIEFMVGKKKYRLVSAPGATFDGLSKPFWAVPLVGAKMDTTELPGGWTHDQLYAGEFLPREDCDLAFYNLERKNGVWYWRACVYYRAVRIGGGFVWDHHSIASIAKARKYNNLYIYQDGMWEEVKKTEKQLYN